MGQQANSGRRASLDEKKRRAAGRRQHDPEQEQILDALRPEMQNPSGLAFAWDNTTSGGGGASEQQGPGGPPANP